MPAPLGHIPVHIREGVAILMHTRSGYTIAETLRSPYTLVVFQAANGYAFGHTYFDDGESVPPTPHRNVQFFVGTGLIRVESSGSFEVKPKLVSLTVLGTNRPTMVKVRGKEVLDWNYDDALQKLVVSRLNIDLNVPEIVEWQ